MNRVERYQSPHTKHVVSCILIGAAVAFALITLFFFGDGGEAEFGFRVYFPMLTTTVGGGAGGLLNALLSFLQQRKGYSRLLAVPAGIIGYIAIIWISSVAGFAVTGDWD